MASSGNRKGSVLLLKAPKENEHSDRFVEALEQAGYSAVSVSVLAFKFINEDRLADALQKANTFSGIVLTSPRTVQAVVKATATLNSNNVQFHPAGLRCFVVGEATAEAAREAHFNPEGTHTGNAENLSEFILDSVSVDEQRPLLFPCAQIRRDTLIERLQPTAFGIHEIIVYETGPSQSINEDIARAFQSDSPPDIVVFFSPSGVQFTSDAVQRGILPLDKMKVYALGPSTQQELVNRSYKLAGVATKPDPVNLLKALDESSTEDAALP